MFKKGLLVGVLITLIIVEVYRTQSDKNYLNGMVFLVSLLNYYHQHQVFNNQQFTNGTSTRAFFGKMWKRIKSQDANYLADNILETLRMDVAQQRLHRISLPDHDVAISSPIELLAGEYRFVFKSAYVENPISFYRTGDFSIEGDILTDIFILHGSLAFQTLVAKYDHCVINVDGLYSEQELELDFGQSFVKFSIWAKLIDKNVMKVHDFSFQITNLDNIKATEAESNILLNWLEDTSTINRMKRVIKENIELELRAAIANFFFGLNYEVPLLNLSDQDDSD